MLLEPADDIEETVVFAGIPAPEMYCPALILVVVIAEIVVDALVVVPVTAYGASYALIQQSSVDQDTS